MECPECTASEINRRGAMANAIALGRTESEALCICNHYCNRMNARPAAAQRVPYGSGVVGSGRLWARPMCGAAAMRARPRMRSLFRAPYPVVGWPYPLPANDDDLPSRGV